MRHTSFEKSTLLIVRSLLQARGFRSLDRNELHACYSDCAVTPSAPAGFGEREQKILEFERNWWKYSGAKERAIRELFDFSATRYYHLLNGIIDMPEALAYDPILVKRLQRLRAFRQRQRMARRLGIHLTENG
ncbi:MAG: DUF3263 domain-containing protein [Actinomycetota bacterium]